MSAPRIVAVEPGSAADRAGLAAGDQVTSVDATVPRDVLEWRWLVDEADPELEIVRGGLDRTVVVAKRAGEALGAEVHSSVFDRVQTCDNHCEFCFIHQLPKGMRRSLYLKDDDYRLSFLYGNFTTLTRFTELDLERVVTEGISPLHVSIHATDPELRAHLLRNRRGATSLRWLRALLDHGVEVHGQIVVCPGTNDGEHLDATLADVADVYPDLATVAVVPLGVSDHAPPGTLRPHTRAEAVAVVDLVERWQDTFWALLGKRMVFAADEYHLLAGRPFPPAEAYEGFAMHEDGIGMARAFEAEFTGAALGVSGTRDGFFRAVDGAPAEGYRAERASTSTSTTPTAAAGREHLGCASASSPGPVGRQGGVAVTLAPRRGAPVGVVTSTYGARVLAPLLGGLGRQDVRIVEVDNRFFGGNIGVTGLLVGADLSRVLADEPAGHRYLLPDVCLSNGRFLDGTSVHDLPRPVEIVPTDGASLRRALERSA